MDQEFAKEFTKGLFEILRELEIAPLKNQIAALEARIALLEAREQQPTKTLRLVNDGHG